MDIAAYKRIVEQLDDRARVLDIGGWERPFNRADVVLDIMPYETRKKHNAFPQDMEERFTKDTWIQKDFTNGLPFEDNEFDFVICGHVLEDIKNPVALAKELMRVSKAGYIEFPTRAYEMQTSAEALPNSHKYVGYNHHRWLIEVQGNKLIFIMKRTMYSAMRILRCRTVARKFEPFFWEGSFELEEPFFNSYDDLMKEGLTFKARNDGSSFDALWRRYMMQRNMLRGFATIRHWIKSKFLGV